MTTSFVMPYGYTVGGVKDLAWLSRIDANTASVSLPEGPCRVVDSWAGPESVALNLLRGGSKVTLDTIEKKAGGGDQ